MVQVNNRRCVRQLAWKSLKGDRPRNIAAILAIALTALLFTALFTIAMSINDSFQESNFRMVGGYSHGSFNRLTPEQFEELKTDPLIRISGLHRFLDGAVDECFAKTNVELHHWDRTAAEWAYCVPAVGRAPAEGTDEAAADLTVLRCLGIEPEIGATFSVTLNIGGKTTEQRFTLSGWWEGDAAAVAHIILIPESRVDAVLNGLGFSSPYDGLENGIGMWNLDVMLKNARHIAADLEEILARHGYQNISPTEDNYIDTGVSWGYTGAQLSAGMDAQTVFLLALLLAVILLTGYLVIYNVFRISVAGDVRFYGLLKTVGTTGRQLRRVIRLQALALSLIGIPLGLFLGWVTGGLLAPAVLHNFEIGGIVKVSAHPMLFLGAAVFSLGTVFLSCALPGRMAAKVSPVEATRYTEGAGHRKTRRSTGKVSPLVMAWANLGRSRPRTIITALSLALSVVLLCMTVFYTKGFDMDKYLKDRTVCDFLVAPNSYFNSSFSYLPSTSMSQEVIDTIRDQGGITDGGQTLFEYASIREIVPEDFILSYYSGLSPEFAQSLIENSEPVGEGTRAVNAVVYGAEPFMLDRMTVIEGDSAPLYEPDGHHIAIVCAVDDYGDIVEGSVRAHAGDTVTLRYVEESEFYDPETGHVYAEAEDVVSSWAERATKYRDVEYEVAAVVTLPWAMSYRAVLGDAFILNAGALREYAADPEPLYYAFDTTEEGNAAMEEFLASYTSGAGQAYNYESRASYESEFHGFRNLFLLLGGVLSFIAGLVGILNFVNAVITGITARRREFAMLQAVGMTGRQLKAMLIWEGLFYALSSSLLALSLSSLLETALSGPLERMYWFFSGHFTLTPVLLALPVFLLLGAAIPLIVYQAVSRRTIVERLRETA